VNVAESTVARSKGSRALQGLKETGAQSSVIGYVAVLAAATCWGTSGIFVRFIVDTSDVSALALAFWRDLFTFLVLIIGLGTLRPAWLRVARHDLVWMVALGFTLGIFHVFWNLGVSLSGPAIATVQQAAMPAIVAIAAWMIWREPLTWPKIFAILLTFLGTVLVSDLNVLSEAQITLSGALVGLGIPFLYAGWNLFGKKVRGTYGSFTVLAYAFGFGALVLLPWQFFTPQPWPVPAATWLWFAGLIGLSTTAGFSIYTFGLGKLPASVASILAMAEIPIVALYAYVLLGDKMTADQVLGTLLVVGGVLLLSWRRPSRRRVVASTRTTSAGEG
jgi:DME family drug/metabolite transporter